MIIKLIIISFFAAQVIVASDSNTTAEVVFNTERGAVIAKIIEEIRSVPSGGSIKFTTYRFDEINKSSTYTENHDHNLSLINLRQAFLDANRSGVKIEAIINAHDKSNLSNLNFITLHRSKHGFSNSQGKGIQHNKFMLLDDGNGTKKVLQYSSNFSNHDVENEQDLLLFENNVLYDKFLIRFNSMKKNVDSGNKIPLSNFTEGDLNITFFPDEISQYYDTTLKNNDPVYSFLNELNTEGLTYCTIHIGMHLFTESDRGDELVRLLSQLNNNCSIQVLLNGNGTEITASNQYIKGKLEDKGVPVSFYRKTHLHSKYMIASIVQHGVNNKYVLTGSHNYTAPALTRNDETLIRIDNQKRIYDKYLANWKSIKCNNTFKKNLNTIKIVGVHYDADGSDNAENRANGEWIELMNTSNECISLKNYNLSDNNGNQYTFDNIILEANETVRVLSGKENTNINNGDINSSGIEQFVYAGDRTNGGSGIWNNGGDIIRIKNLDGELVDIYAYRGSGTTSDNTCKTETADFNLSFQIHADASGNDSTIDNCNGEWLQITNDSNNCIILRDYNISDVEGHSAILNQTIEANSSIKIYSGNGSYSYGNVYGNFNNGKCIWNNSGDTINISNDTEVILNYTYPNISGIAEYTLNKNKDLNLSLVSIKISDTNVTVKLKNEENIPVSLERIKIVDNNQKYNLTDLDLSLEELSLNAGETLKVHYTPTNSETNRTNTLVLEEIDRGNISTKQYPKLQNMREYPFKNCRNTDLNLTFNILINAAGNDRSNGNGEWIELNNTSNECISLQDYNISDEAGNDTILPFEASGILPNATIRVFSGLAPDSENTSSEYNGTIFIYGDFKDGSNSGIWNNGEDIVNIKDFNNANVCTCEYFECKEVNVIYSFTRDDTTKDCEGLE